MIPGSQRNIMILPYRYCHHQLAAPSVPVIIRGHDVMSNGKSVRCVIMDSGISYHHGLPAITGTIRNTPTIRF